MRRFLSYITIVPSILTACIVEQKPPSSSDILQFDAWYTGTFLASTSVNINAIQPSITVFGIYGKYASNWEFKSEETAWSINPQLDFQFVVTKRTGVEVFAGFVSNYKGSKHSSNFIDTILLLGYQVSNDDKDSWIPNCRLSLETIFPSGKHDQLDPSKGGIDSSGEGAYFFGPLLACSKMFQFPCHYINLYWSFGYFFPTKAHIKGLNVYGGARDTKGEIRPGQSLQTILSFEYGLTQNWVLGFDSELLFQTKSSHFQGRTTVPVGLPSSIQISIAPQIEYNFTSKSGIIIGSWCTIAGYNSKAFASVFVSYLYVF